MMQTTEWGHGRDTGESLRAEEETVHDGLAFNTVHWYSVVHFQDAY